MALDEFLPPAQPPPLLTLDQLLSLACQGHIPLTLTSELQQQFDCLLVAARTFFEQPNTLKRSQYPSPRSEIGYFDVAGEKEYLSLRTSTATGNAALEATSKEVWRQTGALLHRILGDIATALNIDASAWDPVIDGCLTMPSGDTGVNDLPTVLRIFRYEPNTGTADPHVDTGLLTLCIGAGAGLQVLNRSSGRSNGDSHAGGNAEWADVQGPTLLIGQTLRALTWNRVRCGLHRVVANPEGRMSIIFALRPCLRHDIDMTALGGPSQVVSLRQLHGEILGSRYNINASKETRTRQKENLKAKGSSGRA